MKSNPMNDIDDLIDTYYYNKNTHDLILSEEDMEDIVTNNKIKFNSDDHDLAHINKTIVNYNHQQACLSILFQKIKENDITEFRKLIIDNTSIINVKFNRTFMFHEVLRLGKLDFASFLLFMDAKYDTLDDFGLMAPHYAIISGKAVLVDLLAMFAIDFNCQDQNGSTPLHHAIIILCSPFNKANKEPYVEIIKSLLSYKVNANIKNNSNRSPIDYCTDNEIKQMLINYIKG